MTKFNFYNFIIYIQYMKPLPQVIDFNLFSLDLYSTTTLQHNTTQNPQNSLLRQQRTNEEKKKIFSIFYAEII
jgi:hypothetical protein